MPKTVTLLFPTELIDREVARMQRSLRRIHSKLRKKAISKTEAQQQGEAAIKQAYMAMRSQVTVYLAKHHVKANQAEHTERLNQTLERWSRIVNDTDT